MRRGGWGLIRGGRRFPRAVVHGPPGVLDDSVDDLVGLAAGPGSGNLARPLADQRRQDRRVQPVQRGVGQPEQRIVLADPGVPAAPPLGGESGRAVTGDKQHRQVPAMPAALKERARADREQRRRIGHSRLAGCGYCLARCRLMGHLVFLPQGEKEFALAAEVVVEAAYARPGTLDHVRDAGIGETLLGEYLAGGVEQRTLRLRRAAPLPGSADRPAPGLRGGARGLVQLLRHGTHQSVLACSGSFGAPRSALARDSYRATSSQICSTKASGRTVALPALSSGSLTDGGQDHGLFSESSGELPMITSYAGLSRPRAGDRRGTGAPDCQS